MKLERLLPMLYFSLMLAACSDSSDDTVIVRSEEGRDNFPAFNITVPLPLELESASDLENSLTSEQIAFGIGVPATDADNFTITSGGNSYTVYCQASYLSTTTETANEAYQMLVAGEPDTVFAFEGTTDSVEFSSINSVVVDGRTGQEFLYRFFNNSNELSGQGRAFYFNRDADNLSRSAILYFECFGFSEPYNREINSIQAFLDSPIFGTSRSRAFSTSEAMSRDIELFTNGVTTDISSLFEQ